ncbi:MAG: electron transfer flavoprotein subunit alpha, partial [Paramuribaculum sp.]|nr:electron transfer flavoprotein subunit alpha [Paramuribaculum sp.]
MKDQNNLIVYCEFDEGKVADVSLELLTKGRELATKLGVNLEAVVVGD